ncbi:MAG TPA: hypothetical protein VE713_19320, partial [Pyrinomonadaceae bacterium]|nr:hypothetical protein [Pyrinomonadaceae bacterium]
VLTDYFKRLSLRQGPVSDGKAASDDQDLMIDDPAVERLLFVLEGYEFDAPDMKWKAVSWKTLSIAPDASKPGISRHQRAWVKVLCRRGEKHEVREPRPAQFPNEAGYDVVVVAQKQPVAVARLRVFAMVSDRFIKGGAEPKFDTSFFEMEDESDPSKKEKLFIEDFDSPESAYDLAELGTAGQAAFKSDRAGFKCLKPHTILIETPNNELLKDTVLWRKLSLELTGAGRDTVAVSLRKDDAETRAALRNVVRCELLRQQWRWQGYPFEHDEIAELRRRWIPSEPRDDAPTADGVVTQDEAEDFLVWELKTFADMDDAFDTLTIPVPYTHESPELIYEDYFAKDLLSRYVRYGLRIYSRYEPLFRRSQVPASPVTTAQPRAVGEKESKLTGIGWRRALVRYRGPRPLKPLVQAMVPLTLSGDEVGAAPLLLVLDETMFSQCGVTEWVDCEVVTVALPSTDKSDYRNKVACGDSLITRERLHQTGYDPLVTAENAACSLPDPEAATIKPTLVGPFGHTKDTGARQALYAKSSFMVESSDAKSGWRARSWDFAKVRFRRLSGDDLLDDSSGEGDWTEPVWVQFLPSSSFDVPKGAGGVDLEVTWDVATKEVTVGAPPAANPFPSMKKFAMFRYCLLLTDQVSDFRGQGSYEVYRDCVRLDFGAGDASLFGVYDAAQDPESRAILTARLVEVQSAPVKPESLTSPYKYEDLPQPAAGESFSDKFWAALFDAPAEGMAPNAKYRVTRVSAPVGVAKR